MELQSLKLVVTDADAARLLDELGPQDLDVEKLQINFTPDGMRVTGQTTALLFKVSFETLWEVSLDAGNVVGRLASLKVAGIPAGKLRGVILKVLRDAVAGRPGIAVVDDVIRVDVNEMLRSHAIPLTMQLADVRCGEGTVAIIV